MEPHTSITQADVAAAAQVYRAAGIPTLLTGAPGTGKSSFVRAMADVNGWWLHKELVSLKDPTDAAGLPVRGPEGVVWQPPRWVNEVLERTAAGEDVVVFLDELNTGAPATLAAYLEIVLERTVLGTYLGDAVWFVAAVNEAGDAAGGWDLPAAMANRFGHLDWVVDARTVAAGLLGRWSPVDALSPTGGWQDRRAAHAALVGAFLISRPHLVTAVPNGEVDKGRAWPSPRTWSWVADCLAVAEAGGVGEVARMLCVTGLVGQGAGAELLGYLGRLDLPDPEDLLDDPASLVLPPAGDHQHAVLASVVGAVTARPSASRWEAGMRVLVEAHRQGAVDLAAAVAMDLIDAQPSDADPVRTGAALFLPTLRRAELVRAAGE